MIARLVYSILPSPVGDLWLLSDGSLLTGLYLRRPDVQVGNPSDWLRDDEWLKPVREQLTAYFDGSLREFDLPLELDGTAFQKQVWAQLQAIPYGTTASYAEIAQRVGSPNAVRAVGSANGRNPISIIVPCHRVINTGGKLGGYGGGLDNKRKLLIHEGAMLSSA